MQLFDVFFYLSSAFICISGLVLMIHFCRIRNDIWKEIESQDHKEHPDCIMPEMPYCPCCRYGLVEEIEDSSIWEHNTFTKWICLLDHPESW